MLWAPRVVLLRGAYIEDEEAEAELCCVVCNGPIVTVNHVYERVPFPFSAWGLFALTLSWLELQQPQLQNGFRELSSHHLFYPFPHSLLFSLVTKMVWVWRAPQACLPNWLSRPSLYPHGTRLT
jgi:hypothetical protein